MRELVPRIAEAVEIDTMLSKGRLAPSVFGETFQKNCNASLLDTA